METFTPEYLASLKGDATELLYDDVKEQITTANGNGVTRSRIYFEGLGDFDVVHERLTKAGFRLTAPSSNDDAEVANSSWWCDWTIQEDVLLSQKPDQQLTNKTTE